MCKSRLIRVSTVVAALLSLTECAAPNSGTGAGTGTGGTSSTGTGTGSAGTTGTGTGAAGTTGTGTGTAGTTGTTGIGGASAKGGTTGTGTTGTAGTTGSGTTGTAGRAGTTGVGGSTSTGAAGTTGSTGAAGTTGTIVDQGGVALGKAGSTITVSKQYFNLGDMRLINNRWGSDALKCTGTVQSVFINADKTLGWSFNRPTCGGMRGDPDFPEIEFGVAPFGTTSSLLTTPPFSSTTLLPIQIKNLNSASVTLGNFTTTFQNPSYWDSNFEFWISKEDPTTNPTAGVYAEIIMFLGWESNRLNTASGGWTCDKSGTVTAGSTSYNLCHQSDTWSNGQWRFFNFNVNNGPLSNFNGKADIKAILSWVMSNYTGFTTDMYLTRIEVGTEIDDNTQGSAQVNSVSFEINGTTKSPQFGN
jgi:hypothetical protein